MPRLVATTVGGPAFTNLLHRVWDQGDALFPLDPRLPRPALDALIDNMRPSVLVDANGNETACNYAVPTQPGDALVVATSGTTGSSKGVVLTHDAVRASALATSARLNVDPTNDHWLACLPLAHVGGLSVVTRALVTNTPLTVHDSFEASAVELAARQGATLVSLVATALNRIDSSHFRVVLLGGSAPPRALARNVVATYGMTETGSGVVYDGVPLDGVEIKSIEGELWLRAPMIGRCYRFGDKEVPLTDSEGWLHTGDTGSFDKTTGRLNVTGRIGDVVISGGEKIWPEPVEAALRRHPSVNDVAIAGRPDKTWGTRVVAFVVPSDAAEPPTLDELRDWVKVEFPAYAAPKELELRERLPRTSSGKLQRNRLEQK